MKKKWMILALMLVFLGVGTATACTLPPGFAGVCVQDYGPPDEQYVIYPGEQVGTYFNASANRYFPKISLSQPVKSGFFGDPAGLEAAGISPGWSGVIQTSQDWEAGDNGPFAMTQGVWEILGGEYFAQSAGQKSFSHLYLVQAPGGNELIPW
jgi:hypothetical protein